MASVRPEPVEGRAREDRTALAATAPILTFPRPRGEGNAPHLSVPLDSRFRGNDGGGRGGRERRYPSAMTPLPTAPATVSPDGVSRSSTVSSPSTTLSFTVATVTTAVVVKGAKRSVPLVAV